MMSLKTRLPRPGRLAVLIGAALVTAACGTAAGTTPAEQSTTDSTRATAAPSPSVATAEPTEASPAPVQAVGPAIPGMTLALDDGSTIDLAASDRPVMLVFWAEW